MRPRTAPFALVALLLAGLGACSDDGDSAHNEADVAFVAGMVPHHAQAIVMAGYAEERAASARVRQLAARIVGNQAPEIETMEGFLEDWGDGSAEGGGPTGVLSDGQLRALEAAEGEAFDRLFAEQMIRHHQGAVTAARDVLEAGQSERVKELAQGIVDHQNEEIAELEKVLTPA